MSAKNTKQTKATEVSPYVTPADIEKVKTIVKKALNDHDEIVNDIKAHTTAVSPEEIREKAIDTIVDVLIKTKGKHVPSFNRESLKMMTDKLNKKLKEKPNEKLKE